MGMEHKTLYEKNRKVFTNPDSSYDNGFVSWYVTTDQMVYSAQDKDEAEISHDLFANISISNGRRTLIFNVYGGDKEGAIEDLKEIEALITHLASFCEAVQEGAETLPSKGE